MNHLFFLYRKPKQNQDQKSKKQSKKEKLNKKINKNRKTNKLIDIICQQQGREIFLGKKKAKKISMSPIRNQLQREILKHYESLEIALLQKGLEVPSIPLCPPEELIMRLQKMHHDLHQF